MICLTLVTYIILLAYCSAVFNSDTLNTLDIITVIFVTPYINCRLINRMSR